MVLLFVVKLKERIFKEIIMPVLKIFGKRVGGPKEEDFKKRITSDEKIAPNLRSPSRMARQDFSEMTSKGPNMGRVIRPAVIPVPMKEGEYGNVNREGNPEAMGPDMGAINKAVAVERELDMQEKARRSMGFKKGGKVKKMASGGKTSQLAKANGIAVRGKSRGKIC
jgi:hypothetical protein